MEWLVKEVLNGHLERFRDFVEMLEIEMLAITAVFAVGEKRHRFDPDIKSKLELRNPSLLAQDSDFCCYAFVKSDNFFLCGITPLLLFAHPLSYRIKLSFKVTGLE